MSKQGFTVWLRKQRSREDPVGGLSRDIAHDVKWPARSKDLADFRLRLRCAGACPAAVRALGSAWREWQLDAK